MNGRKLVVKNMSKPKELVQRTVDSKPVTKQNSRNLGVSIDQMILNPRKDSPLELL